jgi:hypothetical protein
VLDSYPQAQGQLIFTALLVPEAIKVYDANVACPTKLAKVAERVPSRRTLV